jgi:serine/threonine protein kinase
MIGNILRQRYRIIKELGKGGCGETYLAEDLDIPVSPKPVCVVKRLHPTIIDPEIIRLFEQEAQILYQLGQNHAQIPKLYAYFEENQQLYLIQEFIDGYDLRQEISPGQKLSKGNVIRLLQDVLKILVYVHENNVIHRDIKPANIMRCKDGKLVLIDFGVVKQINTTIALKSGLTSQTIGIGTHEYMPPEQSFGKPKLSSDIYALGMTAIQALTGMPLNTLSEDDNGEIIWSNLVRVSNNLEQFITKMVRYDWRQRYRDAKEALDVLNQVFSIVESQNTQPATLLVVKQQNTEPVTPTQSSEDWFNRAIALSELQKYTEAIASYDKAIAIKPDNYDAWYFRGTSLYCLQKYTEAIASCDKAIAIKPDKHNAWYFRGISLYYLQMYQEAIASYDKAITIKPDYYEAWVGLGNALCQSQMYQGAITSYDQAIAIKPDYDEAWFNRGNALGQSQKYTEAITSYDKAIAIKPDYHQFWYGRGIVLYELQKYTEAIESYDKAIAIKPDYHLVWNGRGVALEKLQRYEEALKCYEKAISIRPDDQLAINNRNNLLKQLGRSN